MTARRTVRALLDETIGRFEQAGLSYGHGTTNALDEAAWLILYALDLPLTDLNPHLDDVLDEAQWKAARALADKRIRTRKPMRSGASRIGMTRRRAWPRRSSASRWRNEW